MKLTPRRQGDLGELSAIAWLGTHGHDVFVPIGHSPDVDLIALRDGRPLRVQVKTSGVRRGDRWEVSICTRGGNQSWNGTVKLFAADRCDLLFVLVADGRRWLIPAEAVAGGSGILLGGPRYAEYEIEPGQPFGLHAVA